MAEFVAPRDIPGVSEETKRTLQRAFASIAENLQQTQGNYVDRRGSASLTPLQPGQIMHIAGAGQRFALPDPRPYLGKSLDLIVETGPATLVGRIQRQSELAVSSAGWYQLISSGDTWWASAVGAGTAGPQGERGPAGQNFSSFSEFVLGAADAMLPNHRVATTGTFISVDVGTPNVIRWNIIADSITDTELRNSAALSVIGRSANSVGDPADIAASAAHQFLKVNAAGTILGFEGFSLAAMPVMGADTFLGNVTASPTVPTVIQLSTIDSVSVVWDAASHTFQRGALTGDVTAAQNSNATAFRNFTANGVLGRAAGTTGAPAEVTVNPESVLGRTSGNLQSIDSVVQSILMRASGSVFWGTAAADQVLRRSGSGDLGFGTLVTGNIGDDQVTNAKLRNSGALSVIGRSANTAGDPADISAVAASAFPLVEVGSTLAFAALQTAGIANDAVTYAKLQNGAGFSVVGKATTGAGDNADIVAGADTVLGKQGAGNVAFTTIATAQVANDAIDNTKLANMADGTVKLRAVGAGTGDPTDGAIDTHFTRLIQVVSAFAADGAITVTPPTGATWFRYRMKAGGGGGGGADAETDGEICAGAGGGEGEYSEGYATISSGNITGAIGAGGTAGSTAGGNGGAAGGTTLIYAALTRSVAGGAGGTGISVGAGGGFTNASATAGGLGGNGGTNPFFNFNGQAGGNGFMWGNGATETNAAAIGGDGGGQGGGRGGFIAGAIATSNGQGGSRGAGGGGGARLVNATGAATGASGGAGGDGWMIIEFFSGPAPSFGAIT